LTAGSQERFCHGPSSGLRQFPLVIHVVTSVFTGLLALFGVLCVTTGPGPVHLFVFFVVLFALSIAATVGVAGRAAWARLIAIIAGIAVSRPALGSCWASRSSSPPLAHRSTPD